MTGSCTNFGHKNKAVSLC